MTWKLTVLLVTAGFAGLCWWISEDLWTNPDKFWKKYRGRLARGRSGKPWERMFSLDMFGFENNKQRYILVSRMLMIPLYALVLTELAVAVYLAFWR